MGAVSLAGEDLAHHSVLGHGRVSMALGWALRGLEEASPHYAEIHIFPPSKSTEQAGKKGGSSAPGMCHCCGLDGGTWPWHLADVD